MEGFSAPTTCNRQHECPPCPPGGLKDSNLGIGSLSQSFSQLPRVPFGHGLSTSMPCWVAGHCTRRTSLASQKSSGTRCWVFAGGRRVLGTMAVTGCTSVPFWLMAPMGWVVRGACRVVVVAADEIVLVIVVGRMVVVVLRGVEVTGPTDRKGSY